MVNETARFLNVIGEAVSSSAPQLYNNLVKFARLTAGISFLRNVLSYQNTKTKARSPIFDSVFLELFM